MERSHTSQHSSGRRGQRRKQALLGWGKRSSLARSELTAPRSITPAAHWAPGPRETLLRTSQDVARTPHGRAKQFPGREAAGAKSLWQDVSWVRLRSAAANWKCSDGTAPL